MDLINSQALANIPQGNIAWIIILLIGIVFVGISAVLVYHWQRYGIHKNTVRLVTFTYFFVSIILFYFLISAALKMS